MAVLGVNLSSYSTADAEAALSDLCDTLSAMDADERASYVAGLSASELMGTITTDALGMGSLCWIDAEWSGYFVVLQVSGTENYTLMNAVSMYDCDLDITSYDHLVQYSFTGEDASTLYGFIG